MSLKCPGHHHPIACHEDTYSSTLYLTLALDGGGCLTPRRGRITHVNDPALSVQEARWAPGTLGHVGTYMYSE
jgi:hypothetical protein